MEPITENVKTYCALISRRDFLGLGLLSTAELCFGCGDVRGESLSGSVYSLPEEARFYVKLAEKRVQCDVCP